MPLYNQKIYFVARSDSALNFIHEIKGAKINVGPLRSGTAMSATTIFRQMFGAQIAEANVLAANYPNLLAEDVPSVAVRAYLVTYDYKLRGTLDHLRRFGQSLCQNFAQLQTQGHPKWREVELRLPELGQGWTYYATTERTLRACIANLRNPKPVRACTQQERILGLCK